MEIIFPKIPGQKKNLWGIHQPVIGVSGWRRDRFTIVNKFVYWLVVSTHLKNISQIGNLPQIGVKIKTYLKPPPILFHLWSPIYTGCIQSKNSPNWLRGLEVVPPSAPSKVPSPWDAVGSRISNSGGSRLGNRIPGTCCWVRHMAAMGKPGEVQELSNC